MTTSKTKQQPPTQAFMWQSPWHLLALGFGSGLIKWAPGTFGSVLGVLLYLPIASLSLAIQWLIISLLFLLGIFICSKTGKALGVEDHASIVWDEIVAIMLILSFTHRDEYAWLLAFVIFRLFDIVKPFPIRQIEQRVGGGFGVMLDDLLAAIYSLLVLGLAHQAKLSF